MRVRPRVARQALVTAAITVAGLTLMAGAPPAQAAPGAPAVAARKAAAPIHCVRDLSRAGAPTTCYNSFTTAIAKATGGRVTDAPGDARVAMRDRRLLAKLNALPGAKIKPKLTAKATPKATPKAKAAARRAAVAPITILFQDRGFQGSTLTFTSDRGCTGSLGDVDYRRDHVDFKFGSFWAYRGCRLRLFEKPGWTGASTGFRGSMENVFDLRWPVRSLHWS